MKKFRICYRSVFHLVCQADGRPRPQALLRPRRGSLLTSQAKFSREPSSVPGTGELPPASSLGRRLPPGAQPLPRGAGEAAAERHGLGDEGRGGAPEGERGRGQGAGGQARAQPQSARPASQDGPWSPQVAILPRTRGSGGQLGPSHPGDRVTAPEDGQHHQLPDDLPALSLLWKPEQQQEQGGATSDHTAAV